MNDSPFLWFLIYLVLGLALVWVIGSFITWDMLWFIHSIVGRILAVIFVIVNLSAAIKQSTE